MIKGKKTFEFILFDLGFSSKFSSSNSVVGLLKVGEKHLYVYDPHGQVYERTPLCVLDFYVHESKQRSGYGKRLFDAMLEVKRIKLNEQKKFSH